MNMIRTLLAAALFALSLPAAAQVYLFGMGSHWKADTRTTPDMSGTERTGLHLGVGWRFTDHLGAEVAYLSSGSFASADAFTQWKVKGFGVSAVGTLPISGPWALVGKIGAYDLDGETVRCCSTVTKTDLGTRPLVAIGGQYHIGDALHVQLLLQQIKGKDGTELDKLRLISIGAMLSF